MKTTATCLAVLCLLSALFSACGDSGSPTEHKQEEAIIQPDSVAVEEGILGKRFGLPRAAEVDDKLQTDTLNTEAESLKRQLIREYRQVLDSIQLLNRNDTIAPLTKMMRLEDLTQKKEVLREEYAFVRASECGGTNDCVDVEYYNGTPAVSKAFVDTYSKFVGRLSWSNNMRALLKPGDDSGKVSGESWGTGALIGNKYFITAGHCFDSVGQAHDLPTRNGRLISRHERAKLMRVTFNYKKSRLTSLLSGDTISYAVDSLMEYRENGVDYAIVRLKKGRDNRFPGERLPGTLPIAKVQVANNEMLCILQHPNGDPMKMEYGEAATDELPLLNYFDIDTYHQSSGSPIFSVQKNALVGVHIEGKCDRTHTNPNYGHSIVQIRNASVLLRQLYP